MGKISAIDLMHDAVRNDWPHNARVMRSKAKGYAKIEFPKVIIVFPLTDRPVWKRVLLMNRQLVEMNIDGKPAVVHTEGFPDVLLLFVFVYVLYELVTSFLG
jgi:hypothetical protein